MSNNYDEDDGIYFGPTEKELIQDYLIKKLQGEECGEDFMVTKNVYAKEPWLLDHTNDPFFLKDEWYYFVERTQTSKKNIDCVKNVKRKITGDNNDGIDRGHWHGNTTKNIIDKETKKIIGLERTLNFIPSDNKKKKQKREDGTSAAVPGSERSWMMKEYLLPDENIFQKVVLCKIYIKKSNNEGHDDDVASSSTYHHHESSSSSSSSSAQHPINLDRESVIASSWENQQLFVCGGNEPEIPRIASPCSAAEIERNNEQRGEGNMVHHIDARSMIERVPERSSEKDEQVEADGLSMIAGRFKDLQPPLVSDTPFRSDALVRFPSTWSRTVMELGIINFTSQFVARYGPCFCRELKKAVDTKPQFEFMKPTDSLYNFYSERVSVYSKVFTRLRKKDASTVAKVLTVFFQRLQLEKLEEKVGMAMIDLYAFLDGVDCFADMEVDDEEDYVELPTHVRLLVLLERIQLCKTEPPMESQLTEYRECDVQPVITPIWDLPLLRSNLVLGFQELSLKELGVIKLTAQFVARYGPYFCRDLMKMMDKNPQFEFMKPTDRNYVFYNGIAGAYATVLRRSKKLRNSDAPTGTVLDCFFHHLQLEMLEEGVEMTIYDLHAFVGGVDYFAYVENVEYSTKFPAPERLSVMMNRPIHGSATHESVRDAKLGLEPPPLFKDMALGFLEMDITLKELNIFKLTAQFVARYGHTFSLDLMKRVENNTQFEFMKPTDSRSNILFNVLVKAYSRVLKTSHFLSDAATAETVIEYFFQRLQLEKLEEGVEMAMIDLHAFVGGVDCFTDMEDEEYCAYFLPPEHLSVMVNRLTLEEPEPKRQKC